MNSWLAAGPVRIRPILWAVWVLATACQQQTASPPPKPDHVARVNGELIGMGEFQEALDEIKQAGKGYFASNQTAGKIKRDLLERLIDRHLLLQEAAKKWIDIDSKLVEASIHLLKQEYPQGGFDKQLESKGRDMQRFRRETETSMIIHRLLKLDVIDRIAISHEDIQKYYEQHHDRFVKPEEVRVRQIVTRTKDQAEQLRKKILRGASFEETARKHSLGPEAVKGGDLGYFPRGRMPPEIDEVCFKLWAGSRASKAIESPYGFHLFKLVDKRPARELSLSTAKAEIERELFDERAKEAERYYIRSLREKASIDRDLLRLERIH